MMVVFFVGMGAGAIITGVAGSSADFLLGLSLIGLFAAIYHPVGIAWLISSASKQGMTLGISSVFGTVGSAFAPVFVGLCIDFFSWRTAFVLPGLASIAIGLMLTYAWRRGWVVDSVGDRAPPPPPVPGAVRRVFVVMTLTMTCNGFVYTGLINCMPKLFEMRLGSGIATSYTEIGLFVGLIIAVSSVNGVLGGWLADRYSARTIYMIFWTLLAPTLYLTTSLFGVQLLLVACVVRSGFQSQFRGGREHAGRPIHAIRMALTSVWCQVRPRPRCRWPDGVSCRRHLRPHRKLR